jgi:hypothetical protein
VQKDEEEDKVADLRKTFPPWVNFTNLLAQGVNASELKKLKIRPLFTDQEFMYISTYCL